MGRFLGAVAALSLFGCATATEFYYEGPGQPSDRASGAVPAGSLGVCRVPGAKKPPIVAQQIWDDAKLCGSRTPDSYIRIGYGKAYDPTDVESDKTMATLIDALKEGPNEKTGNNRLVAVLKVLHENGLKDPDLRNRVARESSRTGVCDYTYLLNTMSRERAKLDGGDRCSVEVYDPKQKAETCVFDQSHAEVVWLTSSWSCVSHTQAVGEEQSCHRLCGYDDYCAKQVNCAAPDVELLLCAMGVCVPVPRAGL